MGFCSRWGGEAQLFYFFYFTLGQENMLIFKKNCKIIGNAVYCLVVPTEKKLTEFQFLILLLCSFWPYPVMLRAFPDFMFRDYFW